MLITIAQLNPTVGDVRGNTAVLLTTVAANARSDLVAFPEMYLTGYPPKDLLEREWFVARVAAALDEIAAASRAWPETGILVGAPVPTGLPHGKALYNAAVLIQGGRRVAVVHKSLLPTYDVFDEARYFEPARETCAVPFKGERLGIHICEDAWTDPALWTTRLLYDRDPVAELAAQGATLMLNLSASPFSVGKESVRYQLISQHARRYGVPFMYVNQIGGNDELVFDGRSVALDGRGRVITVAKGFEPDVVTVDTVASGNGDGYTPQVEIASVHDALVLGLRDYMHKCGFKTALLGLSGGIDSAVTCALAARAVGPENMFGVSMPSQYSSGHSVDDARALAENLGVPYRAIAIKDVFDAFLVALTPAFAGTAPGVAEENIQARVRGNLLMALSNKFGHLLLTTGNKTELAVGYCTLYGDMSGGLAVISDVPKMMVYALARYINRDGIVIPQNSLDKPPSAELKPNQVDQDTLPPYPELDAMLHLYVEEGRSAEEIIAAGYPEVTVRWVTRAVDRNEYKRQQAAPGLRVTTKAFGVGRRMPIAARY